MSDPDAMIDACHGVKADEHMAQMFREEVAHLLSRNNNTSFPGAQPVSFAARHLTELTRRDYYVMEKTDGIRFLMYFTMDQIPETGEEREIHYLIDRKNNYYYVPNLHFPVEGDKTYLKFHTNTLLDGELVRDVYPDGRSELKYLVFDCLVIDNKPLMQRTLDKRLAYFKQMILKPYKELYKKFPEEAEHRPFAVSDKSTEFSYATVMMFKEVIPRVKQLHGNDGLIFTCRGTPYKIGTDEHILKWKPPEENTVDFLLKIHWTEVEPDPADPDRSPVIDYDAFPQQFQLLVYYGGRDDYRPYGTLFLTELEWADLKSMNKPLQESVVECWKEPASNSPPHQSNGHTNGINGYGHPARWRFHRLREDKLHANHISTVESVEESITDAVSEEDLMRAASGIKTAWKKRAEAEQHGQITDQGRNLAVEQQRAFADQQRHSVADNSGVAAGEPTSGPGASSPHAQGKSVPQSNGTQGATTGQENGLKRKFDGEQGDDDAD